MRFHTKYTLLLIMTFHIATAQTMRWSANLENFGYRGEDFRANDRDQLYESTTHLAFDESGRLYVGFAVHGDANLLHHEADLNNIFRVLVLDARTGKIDNRIDFPTKSMDRIGLNITADGRLLILTDDKLQLVAEDGKILSAFTIPMPAHDGLRHNVSLFMSPSGKTVLAKIDMSAAYFLRADSLSPIVHCEYKPASSSFNMSNIFTDDTQIDLDNHVPGLNRVIEGPLCGRSEEFSTYKYGAVTLTFLNDSTVLEESSLPGTESIWVLNAKNINGNSLWKRQLHKHLYPTYITRVARDGSCFSHELVELRGGMRILDISPKSGAMWIHIYATRSGEELASIPVLKPGLREFNLSPNGKMVAYLTLDGKRLDVWQTSAAVDP